MASKTRNNIFQEVKYKSRLWRFNLLRSSEEVVDRSWIGWVATIFFAVVDCTCLYTIFNTVQRDNFYMILLISLGCAVCLDVPLAYAGNYLKGFFQGIRSLKSTILILTIAILCFAIVFSFSLWFRIETDYLTFAIDGSDELMENSGENAVVADESLSPEDSHVIWVAALFTGILPFCTSLASFLVTFYTANPLAARIAHYDEAIISADTHIADHHQILHEGEKLDEHRALLEAREAALMQSFRDDCLIRQCTRKIAVRLALIERESNPDHVNKLIDDIKDIAAQCPVPVANIGWLNNHLNAKGITI